MKVGSSNDIATRKMNLQTGSADEVRLVHAENVEKSILSQVERNARQILEENGHARVREWLRGVSDDEAIAAIRTSHDNEQGRNRRDTIHQGSSNQVSTVGSLPLARLTFHNRLRIPPQPVLPQQQ